MRISSQSSLSLAQVWKWRDKDNINGQHLAKMQGVFFWIGKIEVINSKVKYCILTFRPANDIITSMKVSKE